jgi:hypothetical protein
LGWLTMGAVGEAGAAHPEFVEAGLAAPEELAIGGHPQELAEGREGARRAPAAGNGPGRLAAELERADDELIADHEDLVDVYDPRPPPQALTIAGDGQPRPRLDALALARTLWPIRFVARHRW